MQGYGEHITIVVGSIYLIWTGEDVMFSKILALVSAGPTIRKMNTGTCMQFI